AREDKRRAHAPVAHSRRRIGEPRGRLHRQQVPRHHIAHRCHVQSPSSVRRRSTYALSSSFSASSMRGSSYSSSVFFPLSLARVAVSRPPFLFHRSWFSVDETSGR